jgi:hypothetical protein
MSAISALIWLSSIAGAALSYASGRLSGRAAASEGAAPPPPDPDREASLTAEIEALRGALGAERARAEAESVALRRELSAHARAEAEPMSVAEAQRVSVEIGLRGHALDRREREIARREAEYVALRRDVERLAAAQEELVELRRKVGELTARGFALGLPAAGGDGGASGVSSARRPRMASGPRLEAAIEDRLEALRVRGDGCRTAIVSDTSGLLVAATGEAAHRDALAAAVSVTTETIERLRRFLPLGEPVEIRLVDENHVVMTARWIRCDDCRLLLGTLGVASAPADPSADAIGASISDLIRAA